MELIINIFIEISIGVLTGMILQFFIANRYGIVIHSFFKHIIYSGTNPLISYYYQYQFVFDEEINPEILENILKDIYKSSFLEQTGFRKRDFNKEHIKFNYFEIELDLKITITNEGNYKLILSTTNKNRTHYNIIRKALKDIEMKKLVKKLIIKTINDQKIEFKSIFSIRLDFIDLANNFFVKDRAQLLKKGKVESFFIVIKDSEEDTATINADLEGLTITVEDDFDFFLNIVNKYISII